MNEDWQDEDRRGEWAWVGCLIVIVAGIMSAAGLVAGFVVLVKALAR